MELGLGAGFEVRSRPGWAAMALAEAAARFQEVSQAHQVLAQHELRVA